MPGVSRAHRHRSLSDGSRPGVHQFPALVEQVATSVGGFDRVVVDVSQGELADFWGASVHTAAQSRMLERNPCGTASMPTLRKSFAEPDWLDIRPVAEGTTSPAMSASWRALSSTASTVSAAFAKVGALCDARRGSRPWTIARKRSAPGG